MEEQRQHRKPRYSCPLPIGHHEIEVARSWDDLSSDRKEESDVTFLHILSIHGFSDLQIPIPLKRRYSRGRRWTAEEFNACRAAWEAGTSLTLIAASLNRNPQDMIYRLLDYCNDNSIRFTERGRSQGSANWSSRVAACASELFAAGLPAWKIAVLFRVDFEHVEKQVFLARADYGHKKHNPFSINTSHKYLVNERVLDLSEIHVKRALDAFAGEGKTTRIIHRRFPDAAIIAVESDPATFHRAQAAPWGPTVTWHCEDNRHVLSRCRSLDHKFNLIDLDPFVSCAEQLPLVWDILNDESLLFITFGGEYRRSFIGSNRKAIAARYGFSNCSLDNAEFLNQVPFFFLGWVGHHASHHFFSFDVIRAVRYANNCRFWLRVSRDVSAGSWRRQHIIEECSGFRFHTLRLPRFAEVRQELDATRQLDLFE